MGEQRNLTEENIAELKKHLDKMKEANPDLEYRFFEQLQEVSIRKELLQEIITTMKHARIFISSREKMHPAGTELYDNLVKKLETEGGG